jgi:hypothetical protein
MCYQALAGRVVSGLLNGNIASLKSFLGDITDDTNSGMAFSLLSLGWGLGAICGPMGQWVPSLESLDGKLSPCLPLFVVRLQWAAS